MYDFRATRPLHHRVQTEMGGQLLKACLRDYPAGARLSHSKIMRVTYAYLKAVEEQDDWSEVLDREWWYVGSHNMTSAAWGKRNFECGVVCPVSETSVATPLKNALAAMWPSANMAHDRTYDPRDMWSREI